MICVLVQTVALLETLDTSGGVDQFLLAGKERMAGRAHLQPYFRLGRVRFKFVSAGAGNRYFVVFGMNSFSHFVLFVRAHSSRSRAR